MDKDKISSMDKEVKLAIMTEALIVLGYLEEHFKTKDVLTKKQFDITKSLTKAFLKEFGEDL